MCNYLGVCFLFEFGISACVVSVRVRVDYVFHVDVELLDLLQNFVYAVSWVDDCCVSSCFVSDDVCEVSSDLAERDLLKDQGFTPTALANLASSFSSIHSVRR